jgi:hypothetical protein
MDPACRPGSDGLGGPEPLARRPAPYATIPLVSQGCLWYAGTTAEAWIRNHDQGLQSLGRGRSVPHPPQQRHTCGIGRASPVSLDPAGRDRLSVVPAREQELGDLGLIGRHRPPSCHRATATTWYLANREPDDRLLALVCVDCGLRQRCQLIHYHATHTIATASTTRAITPPAANCMGGLRRMGVSTGVEAGEDNFAALAISLANAFSRRLVRCSAP